MRERYIADLIAQGGIGRPLKAVCAGGNGTAGLFAPAVLEGIGCEVVPLHCALDWTFPHHNPNPEDVGMLRTLGDAVRGSGADIGLAFDGDGDRCGVVDETGAEIFADKMGLLLARDLARSAPDALFLADVKSTGLFRDDPVLRAHGARFEMIRTGHSYMKRALRDRGALAAFEKSGHYVFGPPIGRGYDDGLLSAVAICRFLDRHAGARLSELRQALPQTWLSPTMAPYCPDDRKYAVAEEIARHYANLAARNQTVLGLPIREVVTTNGIRIEIADGSWGLVRASSNKPSLVVVVESPVSEARMRAMFAELDARLRRFPEIGAYDQKL
jgi:phosphomannomutase/phosphoglucomutase